MLPRMRSLGVDLASQAATTGVAVVAFDGGRASIERLELGATDDRIVALASEVDVVGIDAPFGWPVDFRRMIAGETAPEPWTDELRDRLRFRRTDRVAREVLGRWPLSVSSDLIALPAMRCQHLLARLGVVDRSGDGRVFEVYPALALRRWGFASGGYKRANAADARAVLLEQLLARCAWLDASRDHLELMRRSADALDALVSAFVARAAAVGAVEAIDERDRELAREEGWIVVPAAGSLEGCAR